jgi:hypothetical protein
MHTTKYGFSTDVREIEQLLGLEPGELARQNIDMDLADDCRWLAGRGVDMHDEAAIRQTLAAISPHRSQYPRYVDALVRVARDFTQDSGDHADDTHAELRERMKTWGGDRVAVANIDKLEKILREDDEKQRDAVNHERAKPQ